MKKSLIALAALAATASFAQSTVTISGLVDLGYRSVNAPGVNKDFTGVVQNGIGTTVLTIAGSEDLGGGLSGIFALQLTPDFTTGTGVSGSSANAVGGLAADANTVSGAQEAYLGLKSASVGTLKLGRNNSNALDAWGVGSVFGTALGSGYSGAAGGMFSRNASGAPTTIYNTAPTRFNNSVKYESPVLNGFSGSLLYVPKVNQVGGAPNGAFAGNANGFSTNREGVTDLGLKYSNGPLNLAYAYQKVSQGSYGVSDLVNNVGTTYAATPNNLTANGNNTINILSANYTFGNTTVYGAYWTEVQKNDGVTKSVDASSYALGAKYVMGSYDFLANYAKNNDKLAANVDKNIYGLGANYNLSKRTALYGRYEVRDANTVSAADDKTKTFAVGVRHTF